MALFSIIGQVGVLLLTGFLIALGQISIGAISSVGQIAGNIFNSITTFNQLRVSMASVRPIFQKFHSESQIQRRKFTENFKQIQLEKVGYQFGDQEVFTNLSLNLERGKKYAIVGLTVANQLYLHYYWEIYAIITAKFFITRLIYRR